MRKKISLCVGGSATVIPGTNVIIKCPVKHYDKKYIHWKRKGNEIPNKGRIKVSKSGSLQIRRSKDTDSDIYECFVMNDNNIVMDQSNISIGFHSNLHGEEELEFRKRYLMQLQQDPSHLSESAALHHKPLKQLTIGMSQNTISRHLSTGDKLLANSLMGEKNNSAPFMFIASDWTTCSRTCGGAGWQKRNITCEVITEDYYK